MNLKRYLLVRMITLGLLCWSVISAYVVWRTTQEVQAALSSDASRLHEMVEYSMYRRQINPEIEGSPVLAGSQYGLQLAPYCIRYEGWNGQVRQENCDALQHSPLAEAALQTLGLNVQMPPQEVGLWGQPFGELFIIADGRRVFSKFWNTLQDLLLLTTLIVASLATLCYVVVGRAFRPATRLVQQLDSIAISEDNPPPAQLPAVQPQEFGRIAEGVNRLSERLWRLTQTRRSLMLKLLHVQEEERRELAHLVHADLGQSLSLIAVNCAQLRNQLRPDNVEAREQLEQIDLMIENAFERMRAVLVNKCPPVLEGADLGMAISDLCTRWRIHSGGPRKVDLQLDPNALRMLDKDRALCVYRTIEESLANISRHAPEDACVAVSLAEHAGGLRLSVSNGVAAQPVQSPPSGGMGLQLLAERVRVHGGVLTVARGNAQFEVLAEFKTP
ncbi:MAG TPA: histidine kinase [Limnobacter sp.]|nr:histidine kinase [Limnobacter sp.]